MKKNTTAFTLIEILVTVTIIIILTTVGFLSYTRNLSDARNTTRITDMSNIKISLQSHKLKNGVYPLSWQAIHITNSWTIIQQWLLDENVMTQEILKKPTDPLLKKQYYMYSITQNRLFFQIAMSLEDETAYNQSLMRAYVDGTYQSLNTNFIPSLLFATYQDWDIQTLSWKSIVDKWTLNLPYDDNANIVSFGWWLSEVISQSWVLIPKFYWYYSCDQIIEDGYFLWEGDYYLINQQWDISLSRCSE